MVENIDSLISFVPNIDFFITDSSCTIEHSRLHLLNTEHAKAILKPLMKQMHQHNLPVIEQEVSLEYEKTLKITIYRLTHNEYFILLMNETAPPKQLSIELVTALNQVTDEITITDGSGTILWVNNGAEALYNLTRRELLGKNVFEMESVGVISPSSTRLALEQKKAVTTLQKTRTGKMLTVISTPIYKDNGTIDKIISISRDLNYIFADYTFSQELNHLLQSYWTTSNQMQTQTPTRSEEQYNLTKSQSMQQVIEFVQRVARVDSTVLITGESGVGKSFIAKEIHKISKRKDRSFIEINCGTIPDNLLESELFGYEKGAFTGAQKGKKGQVLLANGGTLFLDEIGEIPLQLQVKLLKLIQDRTFTPVGGTTPVKVDIRIIAATNKNLEQMILDGTFREDLFYRLNVIPIQVPPLRERKEDITQLVDFFMDKFTTKYEIYKSLSVEVMAALQDYPWPGNIRELENLIERLIVLHKDPIITIKQLPPNIRNHNALSHRKKSKNKEVEESSRSLPSWEEIYIDTEESRQSTKSIKHLLANIEKKILTDLYEKGQNTYQIGRTLGISQASVVRKLQKYGISKE